MFKEVFKKESTVPEIQRISYKYLRARDVSSYSHSMLIGTSSTLDLVRHEVKKLLNEYPKDVFELIHVDDAYEIYCNNVLIFQGSTSDIEFFYQQSAYAFEKELQRKMKASL